MPIPILATKLYIPPGRSNAVRRQRLTEQINQSTRGKLTLVSAPAGFGKTTLVSDWITDSKQPVAWLSLDEADNEPTRFLAYVISALQTVSAHFGEKTLGLLQAPQPLPSETILTSLLNEVAILKDKAVLVLDDYHVINAKEVNDAVNFLLEHLPPQLHLLITTREDPSFPLSRLRARNQLTELRAADLRFSHQESAEFLNHMMGLNLSAKDIAALESRTEGWITGLQLAAISLQRQSDTARFIESFTGSHRFIMDYLVEEVLQQLPENIQTFLLHTSILDKLSGSLCDALVIDHSTSGQQILEQLERSNLLVIPLDNERRWYRYHHLFADVLQAHLLKERSDQITTLHQRASQWFAQNNLISDAIRHAFAAQDLELAANLIESAWSAIHSGVFQSPEFLEWVKALPNESISARPVLSAGYAWVLLDFGELDSADTQLRDAERWLNANEHAEGMVVTDEEAFQALPVNIATARAYLAQARGDISETIKQAQCALDHAAPDNHHGRGIANALLGLTHWSNGELETAHRYLSNSMNALQKTGNLAFAISGTYGLADIRLLQGRLRDAVKTYEKSLQLAKQHGEPVLQGTADLYLGLSALHYEMGQMESAEQHLRTSEELGEQAALPDWPYRLRLVKAKFKQAEGNLETAVNLLDEAEQIYYETPVPNARPVTALKTQLLIKQGRLSDAITWAKDRQRSADDELNFLQEFEQLTLARVHMETGSTDESMKLIRRLVSSAEQGGRTGSLIEILILQTLIHQRRNDVPAALNSLERALKLAEPEGYVRIFMDEGKPMAELLSEAASQKLVPDYVNKLLASVTVGAVSTSDQPLIEPLSEREIKVLQLIALGLSNQAISERLFLALDTVKGHNRRIFNKLQVQRRTEAVAKARSLGII